MVDRVATYRWQLTPDQGFAAAAVAVDDLVALGFSHLYLSPIVEAVPGSTHGYDGVDPTRLRRALGGEDGFAALAATCRRAGLGIVVDIVPNHLAAHQDNPWWWDVLRLGHTSRWARAFDIDWDAPKRVLAETILLPVLGDHYGRELERGAIDLVRGDRPGSLVVVQYYERALPLTPSAVGALLAEAAATVGDEVLGVAARVLARIDGVPADAVAFEAREADLDVAERTALGRLAEPSTADALAASLAAVNADPDRLDAILGTQHYRLARWKVGDAELDYRRFFDVDSLVATRVDRADVFDVLHALPLRLVAEGSVDGLRVDHIDGLRDPQTYVERLRAGAGPDAWLLVEKIVRPDERLPAAWPIDGMTGYEVAELLGGWLTDERGAEVLTSAWRLRTGEERSFAEVALEARREVLAGGLAADVERVVDALARVCEGRRRHRDHARTALLAAVTEVAVHLDAYRSYVRPGPDPDAVVASDADVALVGAAVAAARAGAPGIDPELLELVEAVLLGRFTGADEADVALRFQQLTGPVAAKGEEDTALYRWLPLPHRCEVGTDPGRQHVGADEWHAACLDAQAHWPQRMTTLSTHDTKRSADVRARLAALTSMPEATVDAFDRWWAAATPAGAAVDVDPADGWLVFHTLVGAHPIEFDRVWPVVEKSVREAKVRTGWTDPDEAYEAALRALVQGAVESPACTAVVDDVVAAVDPAGQAAALAQLALQLLAPGVPDVYQGGEGWDLSLVDPDNRRPIDPGARHEATTQTTGRAGLLRAALGLRRRWPEAFGPGPAGAYGPLSVDGPDAARVIAFARGEPAAAVVVAVRPDASRTDVDASVTLPPGSWIDVGSGAAKEGRCSVNELASGGSVVLLSRRL